MSLYRSFKPPLRRGFFIVWKKRGGKEGREQGRGKGKGRKGTRGRRRKELALREEGSEGTKEGRGRGKRKSRGRGEGKEEGKGKQGREGRNEGAGAATTLTAQPTKAAEKNRHMIYRTAVVFRFFVASILDRFSQQSILYF